MIKKLGLTTVILSAILLSGCGGSDNKSQSITEQISERDGVFIIHGTKKSFCELVSDNLVENGDIKDIIIDSPANTVNCSTYGKKEGIDCENESLANMLDLTDAEDITVFEDETIACVIAVNEK
jgi:hypothetical protein